MHRHDIGDLAGGVALVLFGLAGTAYTLLHYEVGTIRMMGPGMVPSCVGILIAILGACVALPAWSRSQSAPKIAWRAVIYVSAGVAAFTATVRSFGIGPAIFLLTVISARADREASLTAVLMLGVGLALGGFALFRYALNIPLPFLLVPE
ncbi:Tripartite tricarboxylate transporter TctB family protein [Chelatococcus asaccharovorans]|uniref:Tripartite tricarboxylate transporter TctB family protein n=2 Tax=Chelatococcus asaccharovorans TaxID=28210 RepID=A0A2V3U8U4_9HYPH|nr:tripartite tricarboxylate transporter TctB family protein [Chelatococcus asaccharovorans]MBS7705474.1 tripartite tricarboxylate transporter TctB family protein [Chelatococcus asaccharovorans]PXW60121.1 tripartite tricarboxylate transporter TctB family protein [Chelatococcus asaccharovorans]CAH1655805.1 Tripartite tricarboxylate transporter TctB family protein [Chelatococcus asaccharovorans]CAH1685303.1 Tripartite tricarboxylate transporter TctB family protein [Chelatococcus asaccharovorans]